MKSLQLILFSFITLLGTELISRGFLDLGEGSSLDITSGEVGLTTNENGVSILLENGSLWAGSSESNLIQFVLPLGIGEVNGTCKLIVTDSTVHLQVFKGYARFTERGGLQGETIATGYERFITKSEGAGERMLIKGEEFQMYCESNPEYEDAFGCPSEKKVEDLSMEPVEKNGPLVILHPIINATGLFEAVDVISSLEKLERYLAFAENGLDPVIDTSTGFASSLHISRQDKAYCIADITFIAIKQNENIFRFSISIFNGVDQSRSTEIFTLPLVTEGSSQSGSTVTLIPNSFYEVVKKQIMETF